MSKGVGALFTKGYSKTSKEKSTKPKKKKSDIIVLDPQQSDIVNSEAPHIIVVAGAGSGKTRVLTERIKKLLDNGVEPHSIVAITFTNLASDEMKERLSDVKGIGDAFIGTIHSFANKIMQNSGESYTLFSEEIECKYMRVLIEKYCEFLTLEKFATYRDLVKEFELGKVDESELHNYLNTGERFEYGMLHRKPDEVSNDLARHSDDPVGAYAESVFTMCRDNHVITFDELLERADKYFRSLGTRVEHLLVDELQDIGTLEFSFIEALNAVNTFYVGDDYQSIYGFKGGNVQIFLKLVRNPEYLVYFLTNNYRNGTKILDTAGIVIDAVDNKIKKEITPIIEDEGTVEVYTKNSFPTCLLDIKNEGEFGKWFILTRTNKDIFQLAGKLQDAGVPYVTFKREGMSLSAMRKNMDSNTVKLLTVHTAKGLEADNVILYGNFPIQCPSYLRSEDERKVMYVGVTRARKRLIILN